MKTTKEHFLLFKSECQKWIDKFELNNWKVYFIHEKMDDVYGRCFISINGYVSTIKMNTVWEMVGIEDLEESIKQTAKHETIHLLLGRLTETAYNLGKECTHADLGQAEEELVRKLEKIIKRRIKIHRVCNQERKREEIIKPTK